MGFPDELQVDLEALGQICADYGIQSISVFGSAIRGDLGPESDIDLLVEFDPSRIPGLLRIAELELRLSPLFGGREIDVRTCEDLSRYFRDEVRDSAIPLCRAA
ncbi:MAG: nucleotidyltransferase [Acidobacteria bacterium]|nr:MAG: nucleotidyltransferase [Acidobacteriota bacterium]